MMLLYRYFLEEVLQNYFCSPTELVLMSTDEI